MKSSVPAFLTPPFGTIIGDTMMVPLAEGAGLLWGGAAAGHQGSRQWQRWCRRGAEERQRLAAWVGGAVWVLLRGGGIGDLRLAAEGVESRWWGSRRRCARLALLEHRLKVCQVRPILRWSQSGELVSRANSAGLISCSAVLFCRLRSGQGDARAAPW